MTPQKATYRHRRRRLTRSALNYPKSQRLLNSKRTNSRIRCRNTRSVRRRQLGRLGPVLRFRLRRPDRRV